jgi:hypothetical protein
VVVAHGQKTATAPGRERLGRLHLVARERAHLDDLVEGEA